MKQPLLVDGVQAEPAGPPRLASVAVKPTFEYAALYEISAVLMLRTEPTADDSLADIRARIKFGMAIAAMIRMMATTISSSISEKPFCLRISIFPSFFYLRSCWSRMTQSFSIFALAWPKPPVTLVPDGLTGTTLFSAAAQTLVQLASFVRFSLWQKPSDLMTICVIGPASLLICGTRLSLELAPGGPSNS